MNNPFPSYKSQILVHYALSIGVENDAIEENNATWVKFVVHAVLARAAGEKLC